MLVGTVNSIINIYEEMVLKKIVEMVLKDLFLRGGGVYNAEGNCSE